MCEKFGNIEGVKIFYDPITKRHMGKARVGFTTSASAKLAVAKLDGTSIMGCTVCAQFEHKGSVFCIISCYGQSFAGCHCLVKIC